MWCSSEPGAPAPSSPTPPSRSQQAVLIGRERRWAHENTLVIKKDGRGREKSLPADWLFPNHCGSQQMRSKDPSRGRTDKMIIKQK